MKIETLEYYQGELMVAKERLARLQKEGAKALSRYDIEMASGGDTENAVRTAEFLVRNHIKYYSGKIDELKKNRRQLVLFEEK